MYKLAILLLSVIAVAAQTTNITSIRITTVTNGVTDQVSITLSAREQDGFLLNWVKDYQAAVQQTNTAPTLAQSIRNTTSTLLLKPLSDQSRANDQKTNQVDLFWIYGSSLWDDVLTSQQRQAIRDIVSSPNVSTNLPAR